MTEHVTVYATAPDEATARRLARALVEEGLAACVNLHPITSVYRWEGKLEEGAEVVLLAKTRADAADALVRRLVELHPYEVPCAVVLPHLPGGHGPYYDWIDASVKRAPRQ